jgi:hypothetical protein
MAVDARDLVKFSQNPDFCVNLNFLKIKTYSSFLKKCLKVTFSKRIIFSIQTTSQAGLKKNRWTPNV